MTGLIKINPADNVAVDPATGHKTALNEIKKGGRVIKYGYPIGVATRDISPGETVHTDSLATLLSGKLEYSYEKSLKPLPSLPDDYFMGYLRENGEVGIRNDIFIIPTVGCVNGVAREAAQRTGAIALTHPYGCSQLGDDQLITQRVLCGLINSPNAAGVLVLGLGCENNGIGQMKRVLGEYNPKRVRFLNAQEAQDDVGAAVELINELKSYANSFKRSRQPVSSLRIGLKCGGSDGLSGITANPLIGRLCDRIVSMGGGCVLTEVPEMFGAETILMQRCVSREVFDKTVLLINSFKDYFTRHNQAVYENPSPGNKEGGITTLEEKSLGCIQKGGSSQVVDVLDYGDRVSLPGLSLLNGPGNDMVAVTNLAACGCQLILFSTGRGTPLGTVVPTIKISTNTALASRKPGWIDFDAGGIINGEELDGDFYRYIISVAQGRLCANEKNNQREIAIFKDGVTL
ncbi:MAG TPA: altronate dehydratase [Candidatus Faeciplasma avium]|uniref:Altronate dehydratase n=1 Tax=Candidatus Faeciplasma avium TaxID=2840798 RepID=A0A9D1NQI2_9FIRM|nr:altronate dehydratase [Candidatus Faeciplasma avium]